MKNKLKLALLLVVIGTVVFVVPLLINLLFKIDLGIWFFQSEWDASDALAFYGAFLAGVTTVAGVWFTLQHEKAKGEKDDSIKYKPIIEIIGIDLDINCGRRDVGLGYGVSFSNNADNKELLEERYLSSQTNSAPKYRLFFKNIGRGETSKASVKDFIIKNINWKDISYMQCNYSLSQYIGEITQNGYFEVAVHLPDYLILPEEHTGYKWFELMTELVIEYNDMFDREKYQYSIVVNHKVHVGDLQTEAPYVNDEKYHYYKVQYEAYEILPHRKNI